MTGRFVTTGNALVDVVAAVPRLPERGDDVLAAGGGLEVGGGGFRALAAAREAGADVVFAGRVGTGPLGDLVRAALEGLGAPAPLPAVQGRDTGFALTALERTASAPSSRCPARSRRSPASMRSRSRRTTSSTCTALCYSRHL